MRVMKSLSFFQSKNNLWAQFQESELEKGHWILHVAQYVQVEFSFDLRPVRQLLQE
jgi:hypothetical protein